MFFAWLYIFIRKTFENFQISFTSFSSKFYNLLHCYRDTRKRYISAVVMSTRLIKILPQ